MSVSQLPAHRSNSFFRLLAPSRYPRGAPPGSVAPPAVQILRWAADPERFFVANTRRHGLPHSLRFPIYGQCFVVASPRAAKQIFSMKPTEAHAGESFAILRESAGSRSVLVLDEADHLRMRKLLLPPLHGERMQQWRAFVEKCTVEEIATWPENQEIELRPAFMRITLSVIMRIVFGVRDPARAEELRDLLPTLMNVGRLAGAGFIDRRAQLDLGPRSPWGRFRRRRARIDELIYAEIEERRREFAGGKAAGSGVSGTRGDMLSMLLDTVDDEGRRLTDQELRDQLASMLVAGHETTATSLAWAFERLLRTPRVLAELKGDLGIGSTSYLDAVIKETLRIRPVVAQTARVMMQDTAIDGWTVRRHTMVMIPISLMHRDPESFPDPDEFRPERFLDGNDPGGFVWIPFGGGTKRCPGAALAQMEMRVVIATILQNVELAPDRIQPEPAVPLGITLVPGRGGRVIVSSRRSREAPPDAAARPLPA